ncbi:sec-independent protein translocase protein TatB [Thalassotalea loyana]|uniref:Sec-independent protein translocase protein TatB n=1 Tax=Thalassotalea loyana TaxID=280483 RepID=A0ABQ6HHF4_9GAMM|nr:Sec-independent protein translocase protein TatB [Thalassotalea loyana]GLX86147.1 sec-independent protein translocase protein TatB [Thalassotalea loyana]
MFDIGFWELLLIMVIGLVVLGPERLPTAIRTVRNWVRNVKSFSQNVQSELKEELRVHELHENLKKAEQANMENLAPDVAKSVAELKEAADMVNRPYADKSDSNKSSQSTEKQD